jgi:hypothetical protein
MCSTQPQREQLQQIFRENAGQCQFEFCAKQKVIRLTGRREVVEEVKRKLVSFLTNLVHFEFPTIQM